MKLATEISQIRSNNEAISFKLIVILAWFQDLKKAKWLELHKT